MDGFSFSTPVKVRFAETDAQGIAHNSNYFVWFEVARVEYLELFAGGYQRLRETGVEALVLETHVRYLQPAKFDDRLTVYARCLDVKGARFRYEYAIERDGELDFDMVKLGDRLGRDIDTDTFLVSMSSYYGRIVVSDNHVTIYSEILPDRFRG